MLHAPASICSPPAAASGPKIQWPDWNHRDATLALGRIRPRGMTVALRRSAVPFSASAHRCRRPAVLSTVHQIIRTFSSFPFCSATENRRLLMWGTRPLAASGAHCPGSLKTAAWNRNGVAGARPRRRYGQLQALLYSGLQAASSSPRALFPRAVAAGAAYLYKALSEARRRRRRTAACFCSAGACPPQAWCCLCASRAGTGTCGPAVPVSAPAPVPVGWHLLAEI